ncbi:MAG: hypothetical protein NTW44_07275 [Nitrospirae bacterium]|nr:hypothetical protein [Nitrospirota bacterium]
MKKIIALILSLVLVAAFALTAYACDEEAEIPTTGDFVPAPAGK